MKRNYSVIHKITAFLMVLAICAPVFAFGGKSLTDKKGKALTEDQKILHVLNRLGFGARPGDVERVKAMGLNKYIDQQLNPDSITDSVADLKVKNLEVFNMTTAEVFAKYPNPGALLRQLEGGKNNQANNQAQNNQNADQQMTDKDRQERQA